MLTVSSIGVEGSNRWPAELEIGHARKITIMRHKLTLIKIDVIKLKPFQTSFDRVEDVLHLRFFIKNESYSRKRNDQPCGSDRIDWHNRSRGRFWGLCRPHQVSLQRHPIAIRSKYISAEFLLFISKYLCHNDNFLTRKIELLDGFPKDDLRLSIGVHIGSVKRLDTHIVSIQVNIRIASQTYWWWVYWRCFDVLDALLFGEYPGLPVRISIRHAAQDNLGNLETGVPKTNYLLLLTSIF